MKEPLYRKVNTRARGVSHHRGGDYRDRRHAKAEDTRGSMGGRERRGLDYTPLFRFLLSRVGEDWDEVYAEAAGRLDRPDPIFWLVARPEHERQEVVRVGDNTYYSGLFVDDGNRLRVVNPGFGPDDLEPACSCCTHTFNGVRLTPR